MRARLGGIVFFFLKKNIKKKAFLSPPTVCYGDRQQKYEAGN